MIHVIGFKATMNSQTDTVVVRADRSDVSPGDAPKLVVLGQKRAIYKALADDPGLKKSAVDPNILIDLINKEIVDVPAVVGPPIAVMKIDRTGATWASRCPR